MTRHTYENIIIQTLKILIPEFMEIVRAVYYFYTLKVKLDCTLC